MEFVTYRKFSEKENTDALIQILQNNQIKYQIMEDRDSLDSLYGGSQSNHRFYVKIQQQDFAKADSILLEQSEKELETVDQSHYLFEFADEELFEILAKPDEWNEFDYQLAKKILKERGKDISPETIDFLKKQRIKDLAKPEESSKGWIYAGYVLSLLGGLIGIFMGLILMTSKKTLPDGQRVYSYSATNRSHGLKIFIIGIVMFVLFMFARMTEVGF